MSNPSDFPQMIPARLRRNGTRPSCENCRIAKARCDHNAPCSRCLRTGKTCYFHPAPMSGSSRLKRSPAKTAMANGEKDKDESNRQTRSNSEPAPTRSPLSLGTGTVLSYSRRPSTLAFGYMGSTSHAAILAESGSLSLSEPLVDMLEDGTAITSQEEAAITFGTPILAWLPTQVACDRILAPRDHLGVSSYFVNQRKLVYFVSSFTETYGHLLQEPRKQENLHQLSAMLVANTKITLPMPSSNEEWLTSFSGPNSRWEQIGLFFTAIGGILFSIPDNSAIFRDVLPKDIDKRSYICSMLECADSCLILCDQLAVTDNLPSVILLQNCLQLQSMISGDLNHELWKRMGRLSAAVTGLGLHLKLTPAECRSTIYLDERIRAICGTLSLDKQIATFMGRPPLLSHRFISFEKPLDVDQDLLWSTDDVSILSQNVDSQGWNLEGKIYYLTRTRVQFILHSLRDEVLELSLTIRKPPNLSDQIDILKARMDESFTNFPLIFHSPVNKALFASQDAWSITAILGAQLWHWHNIFLCERIQHERQDQARLLYAARQMLSIVNMYWSERDRYPGNRDACHWWICCYGIPAASALAMDLWKQTITPLTHPPSQDRAYIIQDLHMYIASLEWIDEDFGNYKLCERIKGMLNDILIRILNPQNLAVTNQSFSYAAPLETSPNNSFSNMPNFDIDDIDAWFTAPLFS